MAVFLHARPLLFTTAFLLVNVAMPLRALAGDPEPVSHTLRLDSDEEIANLMAAAQTAEATHHLDDAQDLYERAAILPGLQEAGTVGLSRVLLAKEDTGKAQQVLKKYLLDVNPFSLDARLALADVYIENDQIKLANEEINRVEMLRKGYPPSHARIGIIAFRTGDFSRSIASLNYVIKMNPNHIVARSLRAHAYFRLGRTAEGIEDLKELARQNPENPEHLLNLAKRHMQIANLGEAEKFLLAALEVKHVQPYDQVRTYELLGYLEEQRSNIAKAENYYLHAFTIDSTAFDIGAKLARTQIARGNVTGAEEVLLRILELEPSYETGAKILVQMYADLKRFDKLGLFLKDYVDAHPTTVWALHQYSKLLTDIGNPGAAQKVLARATQDTKGPLEATLLMAQNYLQQQNAEKAVKILEEAQDQYPNDDRIKFNLGLCYEQMSELKDAEKAYASVSETNVEIFYRARVNQALLLERRGKLEKSLEVLRLAAKARPTSVTIARKIATIDNKLNPKAGK